MGSIYPEGSTAGLEKPHLEIRETTVDQFAIAGRCLFEQHAEELGEEQLELNWPVFHALEDGGMLIGLGLWYGLSLIGYCISTMTPDMLHAGKTLCQNSATFLLPEHRASTACKFMLDSMEIVAEARGCSAMLWIAPLGGALEKILRTRDDTRPTESMFMRKLQCHSPPR